MARTADNTDPENDRLWYRFIGRIDDLLSDSEYLWAHEALVGLRETIEATRRVTDGQVHAVANIERTGRPWRS